MAKKDSDVNDVFQNNRIIYFNGQFSEVKVQEVVRKILEFEVSEPNKEST